MNNIHLSLIISPYITHQIRRMITIVRGHSTHRAYPQDRNICILGADTPSLYLLPRRVKYTRVYTTVYLRVHNCIHTCTQHRSKYVLCRALIYSSPRGYPFGSTRDTAKPPRQEGTPQSAKE